MKLDPVITKIDKLKIRLRIFKQRFMGRLFDWVYGVETYERDPTYYVGTRREDSPYCATDWFVLKTILDRLHINEQEVFVDLGCGKGRALFIASGYPFKLIEGVEISKPLFQTVKRNLNSVRSEQKAKCRSIEVYNRDVESYSFPVDPLVVFMYHPFSESKVDSVIKKLNESLRASPRSLRIVYQVPVYHDSVMKMKNLRELDVVPPPVSEYL